MSWESAAHLCEAIYGSYVNWDEEYFLCPECGEIIYSDDFDDFTVCPVCEFEWGEKD